MKPAARYSGRAPDMATSLIVPCTDRQPMSPPGKNSGETTWQSVAMTMRPSGLRQQRLVVALCQPLVVEGRGEQLLDQLRHGAAAAEPCDMSTWPCLRSSGRT